MKKATITLLVGLLAACGSSSKDALKTAETGLSVATAATSTARVSFEAWDAEHQMAIVAAATSRADGEAKLAIYRARRDKVVLAFVAAASAIDAAVLALELAQKDDKKLADAVRLAGKALEAVLAVRSAITALQGGTT